MQWFSVLEWATWLRLILVYSKPVIWCSILETALELEMCNSSQCDTFVPFHIPAGGLCMLNLLQVLSEADFYFPHLSSFKWAAFVEYHPFAKWGWPPVLTAGQRLPRYQWSASRLHLSVLQSPGQLSAHIHPLSHPPLRDTLCEATRCLPSCVSLFSDRGQMFGSL